MEQRYQPVATGDYDEAHEALTKTRQPTPSTEHDEEDDDDVYESIELYNLKNPGNIAIDDEENPFPQTHAIRNDAPHPISRPPTSYRDWFYATLFLGHFLFIFSLSFLEEVSLHHSLLSYRRAASEAAIVMFLTLVGAVLGGLALYLLTKSNYKDLLLKYGVIFALILKVCLANILLIMRSYYSIFAIGVIISLLWDYSRYQNAMTAIPFTITVIDLVVELNQVYGTRLFLCCFSIVAVQTCFLLWWGAFFIGLIATVSIEYVWIVLIGMFFSVYWIVQVFHLVIAFVIGGCTLRLFIDDDHRNTSNTTTAAITTNPFSFLHRTTSTSTTTTAAPTATASPRDLIKRRVFLYFQCAFTSSFGSICRAALWMAPAQIVLLAKYWLWKDGNPFLLALCTRYCCCCPTSLVNHSLSWIDWTVELFYDKARRYHKLSLSLLAVYGKAYLKTAEDHLQQHPESILASMEDYSNFLLSSVTSTIAAFFAILFALLAESKHEATWPLFLLVCYFLLYSGISLSVYTLSAAIDALIVAASINPRRVSEKNQIVFLRFLRLSEVELR